MTPRSPLLFFLGAALCAVFSLWSLALRHRVEASNKAYAIAIESDVIEQRAELDGISLNAALAQLKEAGCGSVVVSEKTVGALVAEGRLFPEVPGRTFVGEMAVVRQIAEALPPGKARVLVASRSLLPVLEITDLSMPQLMATPVPPDASSLQPYRDAGMKIIVRVGNRPKFSERDATALIEKLHTAGIWGFLPLGEQVLGYRKVELLNEELKKRGIVYLSAEFAKIAGDAKMVAINPENTIRLHAIQAAEIDRMDPSAIKERFAKAFAERNIRVMLFRPFQPSSPEPFEGLLDSVRGVAQAIAKEGGGRNEPRPFEDSAVPRIVFAGIAIGLALAAAGLAHWFPKATMAFALLGFALLAMALSSYKPYAALAGAVLFPVASYLMLDRWRKLPLPLAYGAMSLVSLIGGLVVAGLLNGLPYFVKAQVFVGVKPSHVLPILIIAALLAAKLAPWKTLVGKPVTIGGVLVGSAFVAAIVVLALRSGNDNPGAVSDLELRFRSLLETFLVVRPRTKEFLIGHPALWMGLGWLGLSRQKEGATGTMPLGAVLLLMAGTIGQTSLVNTLCHLHTPIQIGLTRIAIGLVIGAVIGAIGWALLKPLAQKVEASS